MNLLVGIVYIILDATVAAVKIIVLTGMISFLIYITAIMLRAARRKRR